MGFPPKLIACDAVLFSSFVGLLAVVSGAPAKPAEFAEQVAAAAPEVPAAFLQAEPRATEDLPCDIPTIIGDYAGAVPVFFNYVWNCKQETNVCIFLGIQDAASVLDDCTRDTVGPLITQAGDGLWGAFGSLCVLPRRSRAARRGTGPRICG